MEDDFKAVKSELLKTKDVSDQALEKLGLDLEEIKKVTKVILKEWDDKRVASCERGNKIHLEQEMKYVGKKDTTMEHYGLGGKFIVRDKNFDLDVDRAVYPEYLVHASYKFSNLDVVVNLAGQSDLVVKDISDIFIRDYKTNESIDEKSFFNRRTRKHKRMLFPVSNMMDCNLHHYALQLSMYGLMIQTLKPDLNIAKLTLEHHAHNGSIKDYECDYYKEECIRIIKDYAKKTALARDKAKIKPITFFLND